MIFRLGIAGFSGGYSSLRIWVRNPYRNEGCGFPWLDVGSHGWMWVPMVGCRFPWLDVLKAIFEDNL